MRTRWQAAVDGLRAAGFLGGVSSPPDEWFAGEAGQTPVCSDPAFAAHFTDALYDDPVDVMTPFGSDEGADLLAEWAERRDELSATSTVADVLEGDPEAYLASGTPDDAIAVRSAGFVLLRLTGHVDEPGRRATLEAIDALVEAFGPEPVLLRQRDDLRSWPG